MAKIHIVLLLVYVFAPFLHSEGSPKVHPSLSNICHMSSYTDRCISSLAPVFKGRKADASSALKEAIGVATKRFGEAKTLADKLTQHATPDMIERLIDYCSFNYDYALEKLDAAAKGIASRDPQLSNILGANNEYTQICIDKLKGVKSPLKPVATELSELSAICQSLALQVLNSPKAAGPSKPERTAHRGYDAKVHPTLSAICKKTASDGFCFSTLAPLFNGSEVDASTALKGAVFAAATSFEEAKKLADKLAHEANTPRTMIAAINDCSSIFGKTLHSLSDIRGAIDDPSALDRLKTLVTAVRTDSETCLYSLNDASATVRSLLDLVASDLTQIGGLFEDLAAQIHA